jgi:plastocyanin
VTGTKWAVAEGEQGGSRGTSTYLLVANTSAYPGQVRVTLLFEDQAPLVVGPSATIPGHSRYNVDLGAAAFITARDRRFGAIVESLAVQGETAPAQIVVERAMYSDAGGVTWAAGTNALATRLPGDTTIVIGADGAVRPANLLVNAGDRVTFLNLDGVAHDMTSDPHPDHTDCPAINEVGLLQPGQSQQTGNLVFAGTCGFHDHDQPFNDLLQGTIVIR